MTSDNDIVIRLRVLANALKMGEWIALTETCASAADEIVSLKQQIVLLRAERDEAQREVCLHYPYPMTYAKDRGWTCFEEPNNDR